MGLITTVDKHIQPSTSEFVSTRLSSDAICLLTALLTIEAPATSEAVEASEKEKSEKLATPVAAADAERKALQVRRAIVARWELISELSVRKEKEEASRRAEASRREKDEAARRVMEVRRKMEECIRKDRENIDKEEGS